MKLPRPSAAYSPRDLTEIARQVELADKMNYKRDRDLEIGQNTIILTSPNGSRFAVVVSNAGALSTTPV